MDEIDVTILCLAYNHEKYIGKALDGFVSQKTKYKFEILIHDDASTDSTREIIDSYKEKYPNLVFPYYEKENQYSNPNSLFVNDLITKIARGKYIAFCDGDDYWIDENKIEKQVLALENDETVNICSCKSLVEYKGKIVGSVGPLDHNGVIPFEDVVLGGGEFVETASLVFRKNLFDNYPVPDRIGTLDYIMQMCGSIKGGMYYINESMCVYRRLTRGSWTRTIRWNVDARIKTHNDLINALEKINTFTNKTYECTIKERIRELQFESYFFEDNYKKMKSDEYIDLYKKVPFKRKFKKKIFNFFAKFHK